MKKTQFIALGTTILTGLVATTAHADNTTTPVNSFEMQDLSTGYIQLAEAKTTEAPVVKKKEGSCGEGKCGSDKKTDSKTKEGKCGEGKCGSDKKTDSKTKEGKCGEGKCGSDKK